ncbi:MAG: hypothetical protein HF300_05665 [Ignavibacteria bacterium]|jgi:hypothetical protein|nr:hypothetical protein [Ignavibacteria bacterium]MCU7498781.1 hypothetical protein [Ignavibacteria bacterium]MCU7512025.1 hypothetical protein [Ignavibacteria bacterium]MCU7520558.1 hypothetical protein [Ignavibacteria bacterium]MCU7523456.1 hypothetical protein [Ignavibacteria bacterium]
MSEEFKSTEELLLECNRLAEYLGVHPYCYQDEKLVQINRRPDPISTSHIEWTPGTRRIVTNIKYFTELFPYYEWEAKEVSEMYFEEALRVMFQRIKADAVIKAKSEIPDSVLNQIAADKVEHILEQR